MKFISILHEESYNAGNKAKKDISHILKHLNIEEIVYKTNKSTSLINGIKKVLDRRKFFSSLKRDTYILQYPLLLNHIDDILLKMAKKNDFIVIIHDIDGLRFEDDTILSKEKKLFNISKYIVAHNDAMKDYLISIGIDENKIIVLKIFDYLVEEAFEHKQMNVNDKMIVAYAGNLNKTKSEFIYQMNAEYSFVLNLYGINLEQKQLCNNINYLGAFPSDELPKHLEGHYGLIWDGQIDGSDENIGYKRYTKYNNPHKLSLYVATGMPVIVWKKSAIASFVRENNIGFCINCIDEINNLNLENYKEHLENTLKIRNKVLNGEYTKSVIQQIKIKEGEN